MEPSDEDVASKTCPECGCGKRAGAPVCYQCKKDKLNAAKREQRASVIAVEYFAFMDSHLTSDATHATKDMAEQIKRFAEIDARKAKLLVQQQAVINALPGIMATKINLTNPFAVSAAQKAEAAQQKAQQRAAVQAQVQQAAVPIPVQPQPVQVQPIQPSQAEVQQALQYVNQQRAENERIRAENQRAYAELQQQLDEIRREKEQNQLERDEISRVRAASKNKKVHGMQDLAEAQARKERRERAANAALDREAEEEVDQIMYDTSNRA